MKNHHQQLIKFNYEQNFKNEDFYVSKSNEHILNLLLKWPKWVKNFINISGENFSGKTHLVNIFLKKFEGIKFEANQLNNECLKKIEIYQNIIIENLSENINEKLLYTFLNAVEQENKYLVVTSTKPIVNFNFNLKDLKSRSKNFLLQNIEKPDDELIFALIIKKSFRSSNFFK